MDPVHARLLSIFLPNAFNRFTHVRSNNLRFVHYTNADVAAQILKHKRIWMRLSSTMNDFMEIEHGFECLNATWKSNLGAEFKALLEQIRNGLSNEIETKFNAWLPGFRDQTYLTSFSEHDDDEDVLGRLSMWRAYGGSTGVAMVINNAPFLAESSELNIYSSPVGYHDTDSFALEFESVVGAVRKEMDFLKVQADEVIQAYVFHMLRFSILCTKHPGFREEREWRVIYNPSYEHSSQLEHHVETVRGIPQGVVKIPLKRFTAESLDLQPRTLINRIIIGPNEYGTEMREAFLKLLRDARVPDGSVAVVNSHIPLRS
jgi:hypothetical protein